MGNKASNTASSERPTYDVTTCVARGNNPEVVGTSSIVERIYEVRMKGRFLGYDAPTDNSGNRTYRREYQHWSFCYSNRISYYI